MMEAFPLLLRPALLKPYGFSDRRIVWETYRQLVSIGRQDQASGADGTIPQGRRVSNLTKSDDDGAEVVISRPSGPLPLSVRLSARRFPLRNSSSCITVMRVGGATHNCGVTP